MIRFLIGLPLLLIVLLLVGLYAAYGEVAPCRVLAVEQARRADVHLPFARKGIEAMSRFETSQMSSGKCTSDLLQSWKERLTGH